MKAVALAHGAITVVNAIASGKGCAIGIDLQTEAEVEVLASSKRIAIEIEGEEKETDVELTKACIKSVFLHYSLPMKGCKVRTKSNIPIGRGLKSSSTASNAIVLACAAALGRKIEDQEAILLGVEASLHAGVSITGALDDASASYYGGITYTNNTEGKILKRSKLDDQNLIILIYVPLEKLYTKDTDKERFARLAAAVDDIFEMAWRGDVWRALTLNGLVYSALSGFSPKPALDAIRSGAHAAGLSGTGPAIAAVCSKKSVDKVKEAWSNLPGKILMTKVNHLKAEVVKYD